MSSYSLENRHKIEQDFHDKWAQEIEVEKLLVKESFEAKTAIENRRILEILGDLNGKKVLDLGCGAGEAAVYFALKGAQVSAVDISPLMLQKTQESAKRFQVPVDTYQMTVENLDLPDESFDVVYGSSVLHHSDVGLAIKMIARVLKKTGTAVFIDPLDYNPVINIYRKIAKEVRTPTEKPLTLKDIEGMGNYFTQVRLEHFWLLAMGIFIYMFFIERIDPGKDRYWKRVIRESTRYQRLFDFLNNLDKKILRLIPFLGRFCWTTIIILKYKK
jgi:ubiquinone/menaquinone biosynthesis C-methylase UbiE